MAGEKFYKRDFWREIKTLVPEQFRAMEGNSSSPPPPLLSPHLHKEIKFSIKTAKPPNPDGNGICLLIVINCGPQKTRLGFWKL